MTQSALRTFVNVNRQISKKLNEAFPIFFSSASYRELIIENIREAIDKLEGRQIVILEAGGIDRPLLERSGKYEYVGMDIEHRSGCDTVYDRFIVQSIEAPIEFQADLIISFTLMEHVLDNDLAVCEMFRGLRDGGSCHHYIPSKWHPYSILLRLVGDRLQKKIISILRPESMSVTGYPAFFDHCSPGAMKKTFERHGFSHIEIWPFYRASDYFAFFVPFYIIIVAFENFCSLLGWRFFCSGFVIRAQKNCD